MQPRGNPVHRLCHPNPAIADRPIGPPQRILVQVPAVQQSGCEIESNHGRDGLPPGWTLLFPNASEPDIVMLLSSGHRLYSLGLLL